MIQNVKYIIVTMKQTETSTSTGQVLFFSVIHVKGVLTPSRVQYCIYRVTRKGKHPTHLLRVRKYKYLVPVSFFMLQSHG